MQEVEYRQVEGFPAYRVGSDGTVWSRYRKGPGAWLINKWRELRPTPDRDGYRRVQLSAANGSKITRKVCSLVIVAFRGPRPVLAGEFRRSFVIAAVVGKRLTYRELTAQGDAGFMGIK